MLRTAAALQVMPNHAHLLIQLESLAAAACVGGRQTRRATQTEWDELLREPALCESDLALQDDPYEHFFTERFDFDGGPYLVFPGQNLQGTSVLSSLANALRMGRHELPARFVEQADELLTGVLKLSDLLIRRLGFPPHVLPAGPHWLDSDPVHPSFPERHTLTARRSAVTFNRAQLLRLGLREARALQLNLVTRLGRLPPDASLADGNPLLLRPLVQAGNEFIVACPHALIGATARHAIRLAQEQGAAPALSELVAEVNAQRVQLALHRLGARELNVALPSRPGSREVLYVLDAELLLHVVVQSEPLTTVNPHVLIGHWPLALPETPVSVPPELSAAQRLTLVVPCAQGDAYTLKVSPAERAEHLVLELDDLELFATAHRNEPLALYRLHLSEQALTSQFDVVSPSGTERMVHCIEHSFIRSFPEAGERSLLLGTAPANDWRRHVKGQQDQHLVEWVNSEVLIPVERATDAPPGLYLPVVTVWSTTAMFVETETLSIWVLDGSGQGIDGENLEPPAEDGAPAALDMVVQAVALWLVHLIPHLPAFRHPRVTLIIHAQAAEGHEHFGLYADRQTQTAQVVLGQVFHDELARPDNAGERYLMAAVYHVLVEPATGRQATVEETRRIMDMVVPPGDQRAIFNVQIGENSELDPRSLVRPRLVQVSEWHAVQVVAGETLARQYSWIPGSIPVHDRHVLEEANTLLYGRLTILLADADGAALIDALVSLYESLRHDVAWLTHTGVARILTHGQFARQIEGRHHLSSMAYRFLIELVVAQPPRGTRPPSLLLIDELLALATAIIDYGLVGDAIRHDLGTVELSYGPDHALRAAAPEYQEASRAQGSSFLSQLLQEVNAWRYRHREDVPETVWDDPMLGRVDAAFLDLYGVPLQELMGLLNEVQNIGDEQQGENTRLSLKAFLAEIRERTRWPLTQVLLALAPFVLTERENFLKPPAPYRPSDTFPWQFGRELSLVRRPLLLVPGDEGIDILWGNRIVEGAKRYWLSALVGDARLTVPDEARKDKARAVRTFTALRQEAGAAFNARVASTLRGLGLSVRENVHKIARRQLSVAGDDLGDIDVLAVDEASRTIWVIECKDYVPARTPAELAGDLDALHRGVVRRDGRRERSLIDRHRRRLMFVQEHREDLIAWLHLAEAEWTVRACVVMSAEPFGLLKVTTDVPVWSLDDLQDAFRSP